MDENLPKQATKAMNALAAFTSKQNDATNSAELLPSVKNLWLIITLNHMPEKQRIKPIRITVPHSLNQAPNVCIIVKDSAKKELKASFAQIAGTSATVLSLAKLRSNYKSFEQKRLLCQSYDIFLADSAIIPMLPKLLGKTFFAKKKHPLPIDLGKKDLKSEYESCLKSTHLHLNKGVTIALKVGTMEMKTKHVVENLVAGITGAVKHIKDGWNGIQALHVKTDDSTSLPVYSNLPKAQQDVETDE